MTSHVWSNWPKFGRDRSQVGRIKGHVGKHRANSSQSRPKFADRGQTYTDSDHTWPGFYETWRGFDRCLAWASPTLARNAPLEQVCAPPACNGASRDRVYRAAPKPCASAPGWPARRCSRTMLRHPPCPCTTHGAVHGAITNGAARPIFKKNEAWARGQVLRRRATSARLSAWRAWTVRDDRAPSQCAGALAGDSGWRRTWPHHA